MDLKKQMEAGVRSLKYTVKYGAAFNVPNPIRRGKEVGLWLERAALFVHLLVWPVL